MRRILLLSLLVLATNGLKAQVHLRFTLRYVKTEIATPFRLVMVAPDGKVDTLANITMHSVSKSVRRDSKWESHFPFVSKRYDRDLATVGDYRFLFTYDTSTLELPFSLDGTELYVDAGLYVTKIDDYYTVAYPELDIYRPAPEEVKLYYLGVDTSSRLLFNFVNQSADTLFHGHRNDFHVYVQNYADGEKPDFCHSLSYSSRMNEPLVPGRSRRVREKDFTVTPGRCHATLCYATDSQYTPRNNVTWSNQGGFINPSLWQPLSIQTWYVATCNLFLTTLDLR